jgi:uncharacterized protein (TIGR02246 family)
MNSDDQEIRRLVTTWIDATKAGDTDTVLSLIADDVVFLVTGQPPMIGKAAFAAAMRAQSGQGRPQFDGKSEIQEIQVLGDWAYMWTNLTVIFTPPGDTPPVTRAGNTLTILKKQNRSWVLARDANMLSAVQPK